MKSFQPFLLERMMSKYEQDVEFNLSESGVHPLLLRELVDGDLEFTEELLSTELNYPYVNGDPELRSNIAALYDGASPANVLVTVGAIEANYLSINTLLSAGEEIVMMLPNYMQIWGIAKNLDLNLRTFSLKEEDGWAPDLEELWSAVTDKTKLIAVCNPNNPTGYILTESEMDKIVASAERVGAWILADEVYSGAERLGGPGTPSFYGRYDKVIAIGSLSKAYGLPGLRIGWAAAPERLIDEVWARHEYVAISASMLSNKLAAWALSEDVRPWIIERTRGFISRGYPVLEEWIAGKGDLFTLSPPQASAIAFIRYGFDMNSTEFAERLCKEESVLIVPGDHFGMDGFVRISFGLPEEYLKEALKRIGRFVRGLRDEKSVMSNER